MSCDCPSGNYGCECCCASVTGLRAGIHPDYIKSVHRDLFVTLDPESSGDTTNTFHTENIIQGPIHIVSASASLATVIRDTDASTDAELKKQIGYAANAVGDAHTPVMFSLFHVHNWIEANFDMGGWNPHPDSDDERTFITTGAVTSQAPSWQSPPDIFGIFADGGLFVEMNAPSDNFGIRICVNYVDRKAFSPAYGDPVKTLQHYWTCAHGEREFLDGFYGGNTWTFDSSGGSAETEYSTTVTGDTGSGPTRASTFLSVDYSTFSPDDVTGLQLWLDADEAVNYDSSKRVEYWEDKSGNANNAIQAVDANKPTWVTSQVNGLPAISFDGTNDFMKLPDGSLLTNGAPFSIFIVAKAGSAGTNDPILAMGASGDKVCFNIHTGKQAHNNAAWTAADGFTSPATSISSTGIGTSDYHQLGSIIGDDGMGGFSQVFYLDGSADGTTAIASSAAIPDTWDQVDRWIGGDEGSQWFQGYIAEILVYNVAVSSQNATSIMTYLVDKYDLD